METALLLCAAAVIGALTALVLRREAPEQAMLAALACGVLILFRLLDTFGELLRWWDRLSARIPYADELVAPLYKAAGISVITHFSASLCRDSGQSALGAKVELAGNAACIVLMLPLAGMALDLLDSLL